MRDQRAWRAMESELVEVGSIAQTDGDMMQASTKPKPAVPPKPAPETRLTVDLTIERNSKFVRGKSKARRWIEQFCLSQYQMRVVEQRRPRYEIVMPFAAGPELEQAIEELLADMHDQADLCNCFVEVTLHDPVTDTYWS